MRDPLVEKWFNDKKKTYHKCWKIDNDDWWCWALFFTDDAITGNYHTGTMQNEGKCICEIKTAIGIELKRRNLIK